MNEPTTPPPEAGKNSITERKKIGEILIENGLISQQQLDEALEEQKLTGEKVGDIMIKKGWLSKEAFEKHLAKQLGVSSFNISNYIIDSETLTYVPEDFARKYKLMPIFRVEGTLTVAMTDPTNVFIIDELQRLTKLIIEPAL